MDWISKHAKPLMVLGLPLIGSSIAQFATNLTDTIMLGRYDVHDLAAASVATSLFFLTFILGAGFGQAVSPLVAAAEEAGDTTQARRVTRMALWLSLGYGLLLIPFMWYSEPILLAMGQEPDIAARGQAYLRIAGFGIFPGLVFMVLRSFLSALEHTGVILRATLCMVGLNIVLNYLLIYGSLGAPEMGIRGAAVASVAVGLLAVIWMVIYIGRELPDHELFRNPLRPDWAALRRAFGLGLPIGITGLAEGGLFAASTVMMGWIGVYELAAHGVALQITALFFMTHLGLSQAVTVRAGRALGRHDGQGLREGALVAISISGVIVLVTVTLFLLIPDTLMALFIDADEPARDQVMELGRSLLAVAALFQLVDAGQVMLLGLLRGIQDTRVPMIMAAFSYWGCGITAAWLFAFRLGGGAVGLWLGLVVGLALASLLLGTRFWLRARRL